MSTRAAKLISMIGAIGGTPHGGWYYDAQGRPHRVVAKGETLGGIATRYLGSWGRHKEIWALQSPEYRARRKTPDMIWPGDDLLMPAEAGQRAEVLGELAANAKPAPGPVPIPSPIPLPIPVQPPAVPGVLTLPEIVIDGGPPLPSPPSPTPAPPAPAPSPPGPAAGEPWLTTSRALWIGGGVVALGIVGAMLVSAESSPKRAPPQLPAMSGRRPTRTAGRRKATWTKAQAERYRRTGLKPGET